MQQKDQRPVTGLDVVQSYVADLGVAVTELTLLVHDDHSREAESSSAQVLSTGNGAPAHGARTRIHVPDQVV